MREALAAVIAQHLDAEMGELGPREFPALEDFTLADAILARFNVTERLDADRG